MSRRWWWAAILAVACATPDGGADDGLVDDDKADRGGGTGGFREVDAVHSSAAFRKYIGGALALLEQHPSPIARLTAAAIRDGRVAIDELVDLTCWDFDRARRELSGASLAPEDWRRLHDRGSPVARGLTAELDGYMWSNRIYVGRGLATKRLAAPLLHEVNHVINRSEVGYWGDLPSSAFVHEYRAFHAERMFDPETYEGVDLVAHVLELYELDREAMDPALLADPLTPRLLPTATAWRERRVGDDVADVEEDCPGY